MLMLCLAIESTVESTYKFEVITHLNDRIYLHILALNSMDINTPEIL